MPGEGDTVNARMIRWLDACAGVPVCALVSLASRISGFFRGRGSATDGPRRILFIKLIEQGATVLAADAIQRAADRVGRENIFFCVFAENRPILDIMDALPAENVFSFRNDGLWAFLLDTWRFMRFMRAQKIDTAIDLEFFSRGSAVLARLSGARIRVGLHRFTSENPYRGHLMTHRVQYNPYLHTAEFYSLLTECAWMDPGDTPMPKTVLPPSRRPPPRFEPDRASLDRVLALLAERGIHPDGQHIVILNPNAGDLIPLRKWPLDRFEALGRKIIADDPRAVIVVTGTAGESDAAEALCKGIASPRAVSLAGKTSLRELLVLYVLSSVIVTNDSGPGHFAALTDIAGVVLFGPETPLRYGPLGPNARALSAGLACSPCVNPFNHRFSPCTHARCMEAIAVDEVLKAVQDACRMKENGGYPPGEK